MSQPKHIFYGLFSILIFISISACTLFKPVEFQAIREVESQKNDTGDLQIDFNAQIYNPNPYKITLLKVDLKVEAKDQQLTTITTLKKKKLGKEAYELVPLTMTISPKKLRSILPDDLSSLLTNPSLKIHLKGTVTGRAFLVFKKKYDIDQTQKISLHNFPIFD